MLFLRELLPHDCQDEEMKREGVEEGAYVFPDPEGPTKAVIVPGTTSSDKSFSTTASGRVGYVNDKF